MVFVLVLSTIISAQLGSVQTPNVSNADSVGFDVKLERGSADLKQSTLWLATHKSKGRIATFRVELSDATGKPAGGPIPFTFGKGRFISEPGSDSGELMQALKKALQAKTLLARAKRVKELPFEFVVLGIGGHREPDGSFDSKKKGTWIALKLFLGNDQGEVFLNLDSASGKGEFSIKDPDYGDYVVSRLAQVL